MFLGAAPYMCVLSGEMYILKFASSSLMLETWKITRFVCEQNYENNALDLFSFAYIYERIYTDYSWLLFFRIIIDPS